MAEIYPHINTLWRYVKLQVVIFFWQVNIIIRQTDINNRQVNIKIRQTLAIGLPVTISSKGTMSCEGNRFLTCRGVGAIDVYQRHKKKIRLTTNTGKILKDTVPSLLIVGIVLFLAHVNEIKILVFNDSLQTQPLS